MCEEVLAEVPTDDHVLSTLSLVLRAAGRMPDLGAAYERAALKEPGNTDLLLGCFAGCVR